MKTVVLRRSRQIVTALLTASCVASLAHAAENTCAPALSQHEVRAVKDTVERWADSVANRDYKKWLSYFADDAILMPPGHRSLGGHEAIEAFVRRNVGPLPSFTFADWRFDGACGLAVVTSSFVAGTLKDKHLVVLRRQPDGRWLIRTVIYNASGGS